MPPSDLATRREEARRAMEGDERQQARLKREQAIGKRRTEAQLAMESPTHRARREARERARQESVRATTAAVVETEKARREAVTKLAVETEAKTQALAAAKQAAAAHAQAIRTAAAEIKNLQGRPAHLGAIRTLKSDMAEAVSQGGSIAGAIIRNEELGNNRLAAGDRQSHTLLTIILILIFLGIIAGGGTLLYQKWLNVSPPFTTPTATSTTPSAGANVARPGFIATDEQTEINLADQTATTVLGKIRAMAATSQSLGTISELRFSKDSTILTFRTWKIFLGLPFPDDLLSIIEPTFLFAFHRQVAGSVPILILKTRSTEQGYSKLLAWEKNLPAVWNILLGQPPAPLHATNTPTIAPVFRDQIIQNLDTRILDGADVAQPALYSFLDPHTIILTQNRAAFLETLTRFRAAR